MTKRTVDHVKLGVFVLAGLLFLVVLLYLIGRNKNMFGSTYQLKSRFSNVQGLSEGNNVRYAGIQVGTVKSIEILSDTVVEVSMHINSEMKEVIKSDALVSIGTDGIVGNKVVNIVSGGGGGKPALPGAFLAAREAFSAEDMLHTLGKSNADLSVITSELRTTIQRINQSKALWDILNSETLYPGLQASLSNIKRSTEGLENFTGQINLVVRELRGGKGSVGKLLNDTSLANNLEEASRRMNDAARSAGEMVQDLDKIITGIDSKLNDNNSPAGALLSDKQMTVDMKMALQNIEEGTAKFNESMEALQHNFLLRGFFKRQERRKQRMMKDSIAGGN